MHCIYQPQFWVGLFIVFFEQMSIAFISLSFGWDYYFQTNVYIEGIYLNFGWNYYVLAFLTHVCIVNVLASILGGLLYFYL